MARRVIWSPEALEDLADIYHYIKYDNRQAAKMVADTLRKLGKTIPDNPMIGQKCPEHDREDIRHRVWRSYRLIYQLVGETEIHILQIFHTRKKELPDLNLS